MPSPTSRCRTAPVTGRAPRPRGQHGVSGSRSPSSANQIATSWFNCSSSRRCRNRAHRSLWCCRCARRSRARPSSVMTASKLRPSLTERRRSIRFRRSRRSARRVNPPLDISRRSARSDMRMPLVPAASKASRTSYSARLTFNGASPASRALQILSWLRRKPPHAFCSRGLSRLFAMVGAYRLGCGPRRAARPGGSAVSCGAAGLPVWEGHRLCPSRCGDVARTGQGWPEKEPRSVQGGGGRGLPCRGCGASTRG